MPFLATILLELNACEFRRDRIRDAQREAAELASLREHAEWQMNTHRMIAEQQTERIRSDKWKHVKCEYCRTETTTARECCPNCGGPYT